MSDIKPPEPPERQPPEPQEPPDQPEEFRFSHEDYLGLIEELELAESRAVQDSAEDYPSNPIEDDSVELVVEFDTTGITSEDLDFALDEALNAKPRMDRICDHNPLPDLWPDGLCHFKGTKVLLLGLDVYYDFCWRDKVPHGKKRFDRCQGLAAFVAKRAKEGKTSAILLTCKNEFIPDFYYTDTHVVYGVPFDGLQSIKINPAEVHYYRHHATDPEILKQIEGNPDVIKSIVGKNPQVVGQLLAQDDDFFNQMFGQDSRALNDLVVKKMDQRSIDIWVKEDRSRLDNLKSILDANRPDSERNREALDRLLGQMAAGAIHDHDLSALVNVMTDKAHLSHLINALAEKSADLAKLPQLGKEDGRRMVAAALRSSHRADAVKVLVDLIAKDALEKDFQSLLDDNWWILGRHYIRKIERKAWTTNERIDILLQSADGYFDLIELKRSKAKMFIKDHGKVIVGAQVNNAVNQTSHYLFELERRREIVLDDSSLSNGPKVDLLKLHSYIVIGMIDGTPRIQRAKRKALRLYNSHLHRIKVITYDELVKIANHVVEANHGEIQFAANPSRAEPAEIEPDDDDGLSF